MLLSCRFAGALLQAQHAPEVLRVGQVTVVAWPGQRNLALDLARRAHRSTDWPGLGPRSPGPLRLIVVPNARLLDSLSQGRAPAWGAAVAVPGARAILLRADQDDLYATLRHELAHLALHEAIRVRVPLWFDEGYASWAAAEWGRLATLDLNLAVARGAVPDLRSLDGALRGSVGSAGPAYALAASAVVELARRSPSRSLTPLMDRLTAGQDFAASVLATTGLSLAQFDLEWRRAIRKRYSIVTWLVAGGGWGVLALGVWGLVRIRRRRDRERRAALDVGWVVSPEDADASELDRTSER